MKVLGIPGKKEIGKKKETLEILYLKEVGQWL